MIESLGAPAAQRRRRRRRQADPGEEAPSLPLARATAVRAQQPFDSAEQAARWLEEAVDEEESVDALVAEGVDLLNRALHVQAAANADPRGVQMRPQRAVTLRIGYGSGDEVAAGRFTAAQVIDAQAATGSRRRRRDEELRPQQRLAAVLAGRERIDACETLLLRARADLDAGRTREAALQLRVGLEALLVELKNALSDPGHSEDMAQLDARRSEVGQAANAALPGELELEGEQNVTELLGICERVLRRRRVLRG